MVPRKEKPLAKGIDSRLFCDKYFATPLKKSL